MAQEFSEEAVFDVERFCQVFGVEVKNRDLFQEAITHRSYINEHRSYKFNHNERLEFLGDAVLELGYPKVEVLNWQGLIAPRGTPKAIIDQLNTAANQVLRDPTLRELMLSQGNEIGGGTPADFAALIKAEAAKWSAVVKTANIKPE